MRGLSIVVQAQRAIAVVAVLGVLACSGGSGSLADQFELNRVDALDLPRDSEDGAVRGLIAQAEAYYRLYRKSGSEAYFDRHWSAAEGARLIIEEAAARKALERMSLEKRFDMPTEAADDDLLDMPMGRG